MTGRTLVLPTGAFDIHFQVCDPRDCAIFDFYDQTAEAHGSLGHFARNLATGELHMRTDDRWPLTAIANDTLNDSIAAYIRCSMSPCPDINESLKRYIAVAGFVKSFADPVLTGLSQIVSRIFSDLGTLNQGPQNHDLERSLRNREVAFGRSIGSGFL